MQRTNVMAWIGGYKRRWVHVCQHGELYVYANGGYKQLRKLHKSAEGHWYYRYYGTKHYVRFRIRAQGRKIV